MRNCGVIEIDLEGNRVPETLQREIKEELEKNKDIVEQIFP